MTSMTTKISFILKHYVQSGGTNGVQSQNVFGGSNLFGGPTATSSTAFASDSSFSNVFGNDNSAAGSFAGVGTLS
jgi:hypothetical protein